MFNVRAIFVRLNFILHIYFTCFLVLSLDYIVAEPIYVDAEKPILEKMISVGTHQKYCYAIYQTILGKGSYSKVQLAKNMNTGESLAVKIQSYKSKEEEDDLKHEVKQLKNVGHYSDSFDDRKNKNFYLFSRLAPGDSIEKLYLNASSYDSKEVCHMILSAWYALKEIHDRGVVHNDVHEGNLVYNFKDKSSLWVDLAFAITLKPGSQFKKIHLPRNDKVPSYKAPESNIERGYATDIYQLGFMSLRMLLIFSELDKDLKNRLIQSSELCMKAIKKIYSPQTLGTNNELLIKIIPLFFSMMDTDKNKRPTIHDAIAKLEHSLVE